MLRIAGDADCHVASLLAMTYIIQLDPSIDGASPDTPGGVSLRNRVGATLAVARNAGDGVPLYNKVSRTKGNSML